MDQDKRRSLLSFICPRTISFGAIDGFRISLVNRNLLSDFEACDVVPGNELMKVYLRLRPFHVPEGDHHVQPFITWDNNYTVTVIPPENKRFNIRDGRRTNHSFTFSHVFNSDSTQSSLFTVVAVDQIRGFVEGLNGLIFAYGTTGSGKTHTMQGSFDDIGIVPRALWTVFRSVKHAMNVSFMPKDFSDVVTLTSPEIEKLLKDKASILKLSCISPEESSHLESEELHSLAHGSVSQTDCEKNGLFTPLLTVSNTVHSKHSQYTSDLRFTLWISFAEIYNEFVYDLLDPSQCLSVASASQPGNTTRAANCNTSRNVFTMVSQPSNMLDACRLRKKPLDLRTDKNGNVYIKGLHYFPVDSAEEALRLIRVGRQCQSVAATRLNQASSRSHSILTLKAVRVVDKENPKFARVSSLTFCDLAGSERSEKAATGGYAARIREAGNINTSLLTLGRCIDCLRYNQAHPDNPKLVPYRDSKLTRLFQGFFTGRGKACMIVNASPNPELFDETLHALRFSALATRIIVQSNVATDIAIPDPNANNAAVRKKPGVSQQASVKVSQRSNLPVTATPPTVVPKRPAYKNVDRSDSPITEDSLSERYTLSLEERTVLPDGSNSEAVECSVSSTDPTRTPTNSGQTGFVLDVYTKEELIDMVNELSELLFEAKGELVEQEARLRQEMCEAMNRQLIELERFYEDSMSAQEKWMIEQSNRRLQQVAQSAMKHHAQAQSVSRKRFRLNDSCSSNEEDDSDENSVVDPEGDGSVTLTTSDVRKPYGQCTNVADLSQHVAFKSDKTNDQLSELRERVSELEGELADQRDLIEHMSGERDRLQVDITRLKFSNTHLQTQLNEKSNRNVVDCFSQTDVIALSNEVQSNSSSLLRSHQSVDLFEDSQVVVKMSKSRDANVTTVGRKFFDPLLSPDLAQPLVMSSTVLSDPTKTPPTVVRVAAKPSSKCFEGLNASEHADSLRRENQLLLDRLAQGRTCGQQALQEKRDADVELTRLQTVSTHDDAYNIRVSEDLQSFLEHESRMQQMETMEQLQKQIYELEAQFASKHDALVLAESSYQQAKTENDELSRQLRLQLDELTKLRHELIATKKRATELDFALEQRQVEHERTVRALESDLQSKLEATQAKLTGLLRRTPEEHVSVQTVPRDVCSSSIQTESPTLKVFVDEMLQVSPSIASLTEFKVPPTRSVPSTDEGFLNTRNLRCKDVRQSKQTKSSRREKYKAPFIPKLPSPVTVPRFISDSGSDDDDPISGNKENHPDSKETTDDDDAKSCVSEPVPLMTKRSAASRRVRSGSRSDQPVDKSRGSGKQIRQTRSAASVRRLPPLAESTQLLPDSFFADELDAALDLTDSHVQREANRPQIHPPRRRTRQNR